MKTLTKVISKFDTIMSAVTFAEAGEFQTAREIMQRGEAPRQRSGKRLDKDVRANLITARK